MKNKKLCSLLMATVMLTSVTAFSSCDALDGVLKLGENIFDGAMGAVDGVFGGIVGSIEDIFGGGNSSDVGDSSDKDSSSTLKVKSISLDTSKAKLEFAFGEEFTAEGLKVTATMSDGSKQEVALADCRIVKPDTTKAGSRSVTVVYEGQTARYEITVLKKVIPPISKTSLLDITAVNDSVPYRVEAEAIDMVTPGVQKAEGVADFVANAPIDADITSGDKYLTGYNVQYNYFGFTFTANQQYESVTLVLRVANPTEADIDAGVMKMFLNFAQDENGDESGAISLDGYILEANGVGKWTDIVIRNVTIPQGTNTLTFEAQGDKAFDLDYIDFYVGMRYINSIVEIADTTTIVKDLENFDTEKAFTRADVAAAHGLKDGQLFVEPVTKESEGKTTSGGTSVGAIGRGSQMSTTLRLAQNATVRIKMKASSVGKGAYYVSDHWKFTVDGVELKMVERINIEGGNPGANEWWDWMYTNLGEYNLPAGDHLFLVEVFGTDCNVDTFEFEILSFGEYAENGTDLDNQHVCESVCPICGKCTDPDCEESACQDKCEGHTVEGANVVINGAGKYKVEAEELDTSKLVPQEGFDAPKVESFAGGKGLGGIGAGGYQTFTVMSVQDVKVTLSISFAKYEGGSILSFVPGGYVNDEEIAFADGMVPAGTAENPWWNVASVKVAEIELKADTLYTFKIMVNSGNLDGYVLDVVNEDPDEPVVSTDVTIDGAGEYKMEAEKVDTSTLVLRPDLAAAGMGFTEGWSNDFGSGTCLRGYTNGSVLKFTVDVKEATTLTLTMRMSHYENAVYDFSNITFTFAGQTLTPVAQGEFGHREASDYWKWVDVALGEVEVEAGIYTFEMNIVNGGNANIDYFMFKVEGEAEPEQPEVTPDITITEATSYKVEAELLDMTTLVPQAGFEKPVVESFTGGQGLGGIGAGGYQTFTVKSVKDVNVALKIAFAKFEGGSILNFIGGVSVNGESLTLTDGEVAPGTSENQWWNVSNVQVATLKLTADTVYTFKIMVNSGNLDGYVLEVFEKTPETTNVASDITLATTGVTKYELENIDYTKSSINTRDDFVNAGVCVEGDVGRGSGRIYGFDNGSTFRVYVTVEAACILKISLAGFGGNALNAYKYSFGGVELTPAEGAVLGNGAVAEGVIGTVTVAEAGVYCFEFTSGVNVDLDYVAFEVV